MEKVYIAGEITDEPPALPMGEELERSIYIDETNYTHDTWENDWYTCPNCGYDSIDIGHSYCPSCGQAIFFGGEEDKNE